MTSGPWEPPEPRGWAFLVARGRHRGYRSILIPEFLASSNEHGMLGEAVRGDVPEWDAPRIQQLDTPSSGRLTLAYRTGILTSTDLDEGSGSAGDTGGHGENDAVTDEHGRPLEMLYGFVSPTPWLRQADETDLRTARAQGLRAYRRFLADEDGFTVEKSKPFSLLSVTGPPPAPVPPPPAFPPPAQPPPRPPDQPPPDRRSRALNLAIVGVLAAILIVAAAMLLSGGGNGEAGIEVPGRQDCGQVVAGRPQLCQVPVASTGSAALTVNASVGPPAGASGFDPGTWTVQAGCPGELAAGRRCAIPVLIKVPAGAGEGPLRAQLTIRHNAPKSPSTVQLQATVVRG